jgi:hypothetical protein
MHGHARRADVTGAATQQGKAQAMWLRGITGEKWTPQQLEQWQAELRGLAEARKQLGNTARQEAGIEVTDLFASNDPVTP